MIIRYKDRSGPGRSGLCAETLEVWTKSSRGDLHAAGKGLRIISTRNVIDLTGRTDFVRVDTASGTIAVTLENEPENVYRDTSFGTIRLLLPKNSEHAIQLDEPRAAHGDVFIRGK